MDHNCVARLPIRKDDARDPLMWNAAHLRAVQSAAPFTLREYCGAASATANADRMLLFGNPSHNLL
jgi:hypothetical protein